ncbi:MAG: 6-phospho-beta-glucosidase [Clostridiales bacterium]|nr:6-phospho-beta-glucosidase [Clostridiales bacterium]
MKPLKIAVIGAGSSYTPELIEGFINRQNELNLKELRLMDIDASRVEIVSKMIKRMVVHSGMDTNIIITTDLKTAVEGVDFVLGQIRTGKMQARILDETIPLKYDLIGQETTGIGGFMKALRTIPDMKVIAEHIEKYCPDAWFVNFSNPSGIIAEYLLNYTNVKMMGLCNVPISMKKDAMDRLPKDAKDVNIEYIGLNHFSWISKIIHNDKDVLPELLKGNLDFSSMKNVHDVPVDRDLINSIGAIPNTYLQYFYYPDAQLAHEKSEEKCRGEVCMELEKELFEMYQDESIVEKPDMLNQRGGHLYSDAAVSLISAIANDKNEVHTVDVRNDGAVDFMDDSDVLEINCVINASGAHPVKIDDFKNQHIIEMMRTVKAYEKHTVKAGLYGDYNEAITALLIHPLVSDYTKLKAALDEMLEANKANLPQFS